MSNDQDIIEFWGVGDTWERVQAAIREAGLSLDNIGIQELAPIDHLHARGLPATIDLADRLPVENNHLVLDIGCALGGPARYMADRFGCRVYGLDITPGYVKAGMELNRITHMEEQVELRVGNGITLPYDDSMFDGAYSQHVTMNVKDRAAFYAEAFRVIKPGGYFGLSEHGLGPIGNPVYPLPWAATPDMSYLKTREETESYLREAGFQQIEVIDTGDKYVSGYKKLLAKIEVEGVPTLGLHVVGGDDIPQRAANSTRSIEEGRTHPIEVVCFKPG